MDEHWHVPHFEKMLYDQPQLVQALISAVQVGMNFPWWISSFHLFSLPFVIWVGTDFFLSLGIWVGSSFRERRILPPYPLLFLYAS